MVPRLEDEERLSARAEIFRFPAQVESLSEPIRLLVDATFGESRYEESGWLRGDLPHLGNPGGRPGRPPDGAVVCILRSASPAKCVDAPVAEAQLLPEGSAGRRRLQGGRARGLRCQDDAKARLDLARSGRSQRGGRPRCRRLLHSLLPRQRDRDGSAGHAVRCSPGAARGHRGEARAGRKPRHADGPCRRRRSGGRAGSAGPALVPRHCRAHRRAGNASDPERRLRPRPAQRPRTANGGAPGSSDVASAARPRISCSAR